MSDTDLGNEDSKVKLVFSTLRADGDWMFHKDEYKKAIESYTKALTVKPKDRGCYVGISKCYLMMGNPESALKEAENSLNGDKTYYEGLYQKAEALYYMSEFEFAKVCYHRGLKLRPDMQKFRVGIQKAEEALESATGDPSSVKLENDGDLKFFQKDNEVKRKYPATAIQQMMIERTPQTTVKKPMDEKTNKELLGEFYTDKKYLEDLLKDRDLVKVISKKGDSLQDVIKGSLTYIETCSEFRNNQKSIAAPKTLKPTQRPIRPKSRSGTEELRFFLRSMEEIESEMKSGNSGKSSLKKAEDVLKTVQRWSLRDVPDKMEHLELLHSCIGKIQFKLGNMDKALEHFRKDLELAKQCKLHKARSRAMDDISRVHAQRRHLEKSIEFLEKRIHLVHDTLEKTWLLHELGCWYLELKCYEEARMYGLHLVSAADDTEDVKWQMNACVLVAQSELKLGNFESSVSYFEKAFSHARQQDDDSATVAIQEALEGAKQHLTQNGHLQSST